jgi:Protein of unknown function (DUF3037)
MVEQPLCFFSVVRYLADPIRNEAKNIGILLICPEKKFGKSRFLLSRLRLQHDSRRYGVLQSVIRGYQIDLPGYYKDTLYKETLFAPLPPQWGQGDLERLHLECTNLIQFTRPAVALGDPEKLLDELFRERVHVKGGGKKYTPTRRFAANIFKRTFQPYGMDDWIEVDTEVPVHHHNYRFDIGIKNGKLHYAIKTLSFQKADLQRVEEVGSYYAHIWPLVYRETGAKGLLLVEPPQEFDVTQERFELVSHWASEAGIAVHKLSETEEVAKQIADELNHSPFSGVSFRK